jgi:adenylate kinase
VHPVPPRFRHAEGDTVDRQVVSARPQRLVLIGPPGSGKSTVTPALLDRFGLARIATGERLRAEMTAGSELGRAAAAFVDRGALVPDTLMDGLLRTILDTVPHGQGFLFDGYPRNLHQAELLDALLAERGRPLTVVLALELPDAEILRRLGGRRLCTGAGEPWTLHVDDAAAVARCRAQGGTLVQRDDDRPEVIAQRLGVYHAQTEPLLAHYRAAGLLHGLDATGDPAEVQARALALVTPAQ